VTAQRGVAPLPQGGANPARRRQRVVLSEVLDWCIDYSNDTPSMWLVTKVAWYLVGGFSNLSAPASNYKATFSLAQAQFEVRVRCRVCVCTCFLSLAACLCHFQHHHLCVGRGGEKGVQLV
jgi:hypothetical protein